MNKILILILTFLPLTLFGQQLKCCETENEVEELLNGKWKTEKNDKKYIHEYEFKDGKGSFFVYETNEKNELTRNTELEPIIKIIKTKNGFEIKNQFKFGGISIPIKYLDSQKLIITSAENKNIIFYKIP